MCDRRSNFCKEERKSTAGGTENSHWRDLNEQYFHVGNYSEGSITEVIFRGRPSWSAAEEKEEEY